LGDRSFWNAYSIDGRGRFYSTDYFAYQREDHVRALFRFANGKKLGQRGLRWLEAYVATCAGNAAKRSWDLRMIWTVRYRPLIEHVAADPDATFDIWSKADEPFQFVAACRELIAAYRDPESFVTYLPISFDGTCNAIQHWAAITGDRETAIRVNLIA